MKQDNEDAPHLPPRIPLTRRSLVQQAGLGALSFTVGGAPLFLTPKEARARAVPLSTLSAANASTLDALGETLLPGAAAAGLTQYIDHQISADPADCLLIARYLSIAPPYSDFYQASLAAIDQFAVTALGKPFAASAVPARNALVKRMASEAIPDWSSRFPAFLTYFAIRNDAVDVVYGTMEGFDKLNIPYMPHIEPARKW